MTADVQSRLSAFVEDLAAAVGALAGTPAESAAGPFPEGRHWVATLTAAGDQSGRCAVTIDHAGATALSRLVTGVGDEADVEDASLADLLRNLVSQAAAASAGRPSAERLELTLSALEPAVGAAPSGGEMGRTVTVAGLAAPISLVVVWTDAPDAAAEVDRLAPSDERLGSRIDVILDIDLPVVVRFGHTELPIRALSRLVPGSVIDLGRSPDDPVDVLVSNRVVARGEVVIVGGNYGVRILDVTSQSERAHSMEM